jgi:NAD-reducing hydrogenase large subunit
LGVKQLTPTAEKMRRLMHYGQMLQSHALHFFHLSSPDLLFGFGSDVAARNIVGVVAPIRRSQRKACCCASTARK